MSDLIFVHYALRALAANIEQLKELYENAKFLETLLNDLKVCVAAGFRLVVIEPETAWNGSCDRPWPLKGS
ncbi:hypothetical protein [Rhodoferax sp.]|uniref:hypothetical protein n=1 Tax=Rhodoferax sp. TaxID=50421 RepID=UPI00374D7C2B